MSKSGTLAARRVAGVKSSKIHGLLVVSLDANEQFHSRHRCCEACCRRKIKVRNRAGQEVEEFYHRMMYASIQGPQMGVVLDVEPIRPEEDEAAAALRMLGRMRRLYGPRFFDGVAEHGDGDVLRISFDKTLHYLHPLWMILQCSEGLLSKHQVQEMTRRVMVARFKSAGQRVEAGVFLVDVFCLGVKWAAYESCDRQDYLDRIRGHYESEIPMVAVESGCARKLVEQAAADAHGLGFPPHLDYKKAARVFGGLQAEQCAQHFTFGREGKPFYCRGPKETEAQARRIVWQLEQRCGPGKYDYLVALGDSEDFVRAFE